MRRTVRTTTTTNGMKALTSTGNALVDLFSNIGAMRGQNVTPQFDAAFEQDPILATKIALWARDIRGGAGERQLFRDILVHLEKTDNEMLAVIMPHIPFYGRWDDMLVFTTPAMRNMAFGYIKKAIEAKNGLCCKWMPRKGAVATQLRNFLGSSPKDYRKTLVELSNTVEQLMCANEWDSIEFAHVPSVASARYQKAFGKRAPEQYGKYIQALEKGEATINASAVYPYDVIRSMRMGNAAVAEAQWKALPNYVGDASIMPMVDVSGSMTCLAGGKGSVSCMDVAISLGLYLADKNSGAFHDVFLNFNGNPTINVLSGSLVQKYQTMARSSWDMSTNLEGAFRAILNLATENNVPQEDMPKTLLILSDMQFNQCIANPGASAMQMIKDMYAMAGYEVPQVVFWNLHAMGNSPVKYNEAGVALVSGFSPAIMGSVLGCEIKEATPEDIMMETLNKERYNLPWAEQE